MKKGLFILSIIVFAFGAPVEGATLASPCGFLLATIHGKNTEPTKLYLNLIRVLISEKNALTVEDFQQLLAQDQLQSPLDILQLPLSPSMHFAFDTAFKELIAKHHDSIHWGEVKEELESQLVKVGIDVHRRDISRRETANLWIPILKNEVPIIGDSLNLRSFRAASDIPIIQTRKEGVFTLYDPLTDKTILTVPEVSGYSLATEANGNVLLLLMHQPNSESVSLYELNHSNEISLKYDRLETPDYTDIPNTWTAFAAQPGLKINDAGEPVIIRSISDVDKDNVYLNRGHLDFALHSGAQLFTPVLPGEQTQRYSQVRWSFDFTNSNPSLVLKLDSTPGETRIPLRSSWLSVHQWTGLQLENVTPEGLFFSAMKGNHWWWVDTRQKVIRYIGWQNTGSTFKYLSSANGVTSIVDPTGAGAIEIYDAKDDQTRRYPLPETIVTPHSVLLKKKSGEHFAFIGSIRPKFLSNIVMVFSFQTRSYLTLKLPKELCLIDVYEADDGKIMGLFQDDQNLQTIQLLGPI